MKVLTKDQILKAVDVNTESIEVPEWGGTVSIKCMHGSARDEFEMFCQARTKGKQMDTKQVKVKLLSLCIVDANGDTIFAKEDLESFNKKNGGTIDRLFTVAQKLNGIGADALEDLRKN